MQAEFGTFHDGVVLYANNAASPEILARFAEITDEIKGATGVVFEEVADADAVKSQVESSEAYGLVTLNADGFQYFRSTFNEPEDAVLIRNTFAQIAGATEPTEAPTIERVVLPSQPINAQSYYAFASLAFSILFMGFTRGLLRSSGEGIGHHQSHPIVKGGRWAHVCGESHHGRLLWLCTNCDGLDRIVLDSAHLMGR